MAFVSDTSKERIKYEYELLLSLEEKCTTCDLLKGLTPDKEYIYTLHGILPPAKIACAHYSNSKTYAVYSTGNFDEAQLFIFESFLDEVRSSANEEQNEQIVVFSKEDYNAIMNFNNGELIDVKLCV